MKKIFVLTGEPSGDKLASKVISKVQQSKNNIEYLCVGGDNLNSLGISSIFELKEITYMAFTDVFLNIFKIRNKIKKTVDEIIKFNPDILFSVDSPDFTLRVAEIVKKKNPKKDLESVEKTRQEKKIKKIETSKEEILKTKKIEPEVHKKEQKKEEK